MSDDASTDPVLLDASVDPTPELGDHPDDLTPEEAAAGLAMWHAVDDLDDTSNGLVGAAPLVGLGLTATARARLVRECLLRHGVPEVSIELQEGRPTTGDPWNACQPVSVFSHHIASRPTPTDPTPGLSLVKRGRPDLGGPLCNGTAGVDLVYRIICLGLANHPGEGGALTVSGPVGAYTMPKDVARPYAWGTEYEGGFEDATWDRVYTNARTGISMTFREFMGRANAGLVEAIWLINGLGKTPKPGADLSGYHLEHKTWAPTRKVDRLNYTTDSGRAEVRKYDTPPPEEDDVSAKEVWDYKIPVWDRDKGATLPAKAVLAQAHKRSLRAAQTAQAALAQATANRKAIAALAATVGNREAVAAVTAALGPDVDAPDLDETSDETEG